MSRIRMVALILALVAACAILPTSARDGEERSPSGAAPAVSKPTRPRTRPARRGRRQRRMRLTDERIAEALAFAEKDLPKLHGQIVQYQQEDPGRARSMIRWVLYIMRRVKQYPLEARPAVIGRHRAMYGIRGTVRQFRATEDAGERAALKRRLTRLLGEYFSFDLAVKEHDVKLLEKRLVDLRKRIEDRRGRRAEVIQGRLERLLRPRTGSRPTSRPHRQR